REGQRRVAGVRGGNRELERLADQRGQRRRRGEQDGRGAPPAGQHPQHEGLGGRTTAGAGDRPGHGGGAQLRRGGGPGDPAGDGVHGHARRGLGQPVGERVTVGVGRLGGVLVRAAEQDLRRRGGGENRRPVRGGQQHHDRVDRHL